MSTDDNNRKLILARRARFMAAALAASGCDDAPRPRTCLTVIEQGFHSDGGKIDEWAEERARLNPPPEAPPRKPPPAPCLSVMPSPEPCLEVAPPPPPPRVCLTPPRHIDDQDHQPQKPDAGAKPGRKKK